MHPKDLIIGISIAAAGYVLGRAVVLFGQQNNIPFLNKLT